MTAEIRQAKFELHSGVVLTVTPLTGFAVRALHARAAELHPEPERTPFEVEIKDALIKGTKMRAEDSPEWLALMNVVLKRRQQAQIGLLLDATLAVDNRAELIAPYLPTATAIRDALENTPAGAAMVSDFITVLIGNLAEEFEVSALVRLAQGATPLTDAEIIDGWRYFRPMALRKPGRIDRHAAKRTQGVQAQEQADGRPDAAGDGSSGEVRANPRPDDENSGGSELVRPAEGDAGGVGG